LDKKEQFRQPQVGKRKKSAEEADDILVGPSVVVVVVVHLRLRVCNTCFVFRLFWLGI
jgi:hypothetical protein